MKALKIDRIPMSRCHLTSKKGKSSIVFCVSDCVVLCEDFLSFSFITCKCLDQECTRDVPCQVCMEKIRAHKAFYRIIHIAQLGMSCTVQGLQRRTAIYMDRKNKLSKSAKREEEDGN